MNDQLDTLSPEGLEQRLVDLLANWTPPAGEPTGMYVLKPSAYLTKELVDDAARFAQERLQAKE